MLHSERISLPEACWLQLKAYGLSQGLTSPAQAIKALLADHAEITAWIAKQTPALLRKQP